MFFSKNIQNNVNPRLMDTLLHLITFENNVQCFIKRGFIGERFNLVFKKNILRKIAEI